MKRIFICLLILWSISPLFAQNAKKDTSNTEQVQPSESTTDQQGDEESPKDKKKKKKKEPKQEVKKDTKKTKSTTTTIELKKATPQEKGKKVQGTKASKKSNEPAAEAIDVIYYYYRLPIELLPQVKDYITTKNKEDKYAKLHDDNDFRKTFIRTKNTDAGYLQLNRPGEDKKYTRLQLFTAKSGQVYMAVEQSECTPLCTNAFHVYKRNGTNWDDVTTTEFPISPNKEILSTLKTRYKKEYGDLDVFNSKGYDNDENLKKGLMYYISPDEGKIVLKEQAMNLKLMEYSFDAAKSKFIAKKTDK